MTLNECRECGSAAVEQVRGKMGYGDYKMVQRPTRKGYMEFNPDFYKEVWIDESNKNDFRISCTECDNATPWNKADAPNMPGVGAQYSRDLWNKLNPAS